SMSPTALVIIADGSEEIEAVVVIDVLRRAGVYVTVAGLTDDVTVTCSRNVKIQPDVNIATAAKNVPYDVIILPGGLKGANAMSKATSVKDLLTDQDKSCRLIGAICAAPMVLKSHDIGAGRNVTSYPAFKDELSEMFVYNDYDVVVDGHVVTSRGPGTAMKFALKVVRLLCGDDVTNTTASALLFKL
uniref:protein deglycase n=2 Tax=Ciona intestinalis TaxID=7719 RepID=F6U899_CIOIN